MTYGRRMARRDGHTSKRPSLRLQCDRCDYLIEAEGADALHAVMMAHAVDGHDDRFRDLSPAQVQELRRAIDADIRGMIADQNPG